MSGYDTGARARRLPEAAKRSQVRDGSGEDRSAFARDRARVLHSYAFRRLADKTQVVTPGSDDFPRTRLTHSLEVAQIGREMGAALGCDPDVVDAAGLAHDLGHPPFGHNGELALNEVAQHCGGFEGNAQTFRILTRLEPKLLGEDGQPAGLNLTRAVLDACCKYPWMRQEGTIKFGVYADDLPAFEWVRDGRVDQRRCLEAQVMDWADDVAYSVHDVEDGIHAGHIRLAELDEPAREELCELAASTYSPLPPGELAGVLDQLLELPSLRDLASYDRSLLAQSRAKRATSELTGRFVSAAVTSTRRLYDGQPLSRFDADVTIPRDTVAECALLKALANRYVMNRQGVAQLQARQRDLLRELVAAVLARAPRTLELEMASAWEQASSPAARLRVAIDQVAQLTDSAALAWHRRLVDGGSPLGRGVLSTDDPLLD